MNKLYVEMCHGPKFTFNIDHIAYVSVCEHCVFITVAGGDQTCIQRENPEAAQKYYNEIVSKLDGERVE